MNHTSMKEKDSAPSTTDAKRHDSIDLYNNLQTFAKHIPRLLLRQLITTIIEGVAIAIDHGGSDCELVIPPPSSSAPRVTSTETKTAVGGLLRELFVLKHPVNIVASGLQSIKRFHGALLFVDISGFTKLSQRLHVDALRHHINAYFHKILTVVDRFGGDVIKFAGDALFVIFQTECTSTVGTEEFKQAAKRAVCKAVSCGKEITHTCSDYPVPLTGDKTKNMNSASLVAILEHQQDNDPHKRNLAQRPTTNPSAAVPSIQTATTDTAGGDAALSPSKEKEEEEKFIFLNVHAGVSVGTFAGVDVGAHNRWEYLLVSDALGTVAEAEEQAGSGELVICAASHALAHEDDTIQLPPLAPSSKSSSSPSSPRSTSRPSTASRPTLQAQSEALRKSSAQEEEGVEKRLPTSLYPGADGEAGAGAGSRRTHPEHLSENESGRANQGGLEPDFSLQQLQHAASQQVLPCGCVPTLKGFYCIKPEICADAESRGVATQQSAATGTVSRSGSEDQASDFIEGEFKMMGAITEDISRGFALLVPSLRRTAYYQRLQAVVQQQHHRSTGALSTALAPSPSPSRSATRSLSSADDSNSANPNGKIPKKNQLREASKDDDFVSVSAPMAVFGETALVNEADELLFEVYQRWMKERLAEECARHTHEASRGEFELPSEDLSLARSLMTSSVSLALSPLPADSASEQNAKSESSETSSESNSCNGSVKSKLSGVDDSHSSALRSALEAFLSPLEGRLNRPTISSPCFIPSGAADGVDARERVLARSETESSPIDRPSAPLISPQARNLRTTVSVDALATVPMSDSGHGSSSSSGGSFVARMRGTVSPGFSGSAYPRGSLHSSSRGLSGSSNNALRTRTQNQHERVLQLDQALTAEVRSVIVLFISVDMTLQSLYLDSDSHSGPPATLIDDDKTKSAKLKNVDASFASPFHFLPRSQAALLADLELLSTFQCCMQVITGVLHEQGGQLRQFIVDDKGTVCIGTFGLRGGAHYDNAAAAIEAAGRIVAALRDEGLTSSIGITSGMAYCGPVGSPQRHEYSVMGPSTNLSARLMGKARPFEVICDVETRKRDRTHIFLKLSSVQAKGYAQPVLTFKPLSDEEISSGAAEKQRAARSKGNANKSGEYGYVNYSQEFDSAMVIRRGSISGTSISAPAGQSASKTAIRGRDEELQKVSKFLLPSLLIENQREEKSSISAGTQTTCSGSSVIAAAMVAAREALDSISEVSALPTELHHVDDDSPDKYRLDVALLARLSVVTGAHGIGKTSFLRAFYDRVHRLSRSRKSLNIAVLRSNSGVFNSSQPFGLWRSVIEQALKLLSLTQECLELENFPSKAPQTTIPKQKKMHLKACPLRGLTFVLRSVNETLQQLKPLINLLKVIKEEIPENDHTKGMSAQARISSTSDLLACIIQQYAVITGKVLVIVLDEAQSMDSLSMKLLHQVWERNTGVVIIAAYRSTQQQLNTLGQTEGRLNSIAAEVSPTSRFKTIKNEDHTALEIFKLFTDVTSVEIDQDNSMPAVEGQKRFQILELPPLSNGAVCGIANDIFSKMNCFESIQAQVRSILDDIAEMCGGNPLYAFELTSALVDTCISRHQSGQPCELAKLLSTFRVGRIEEVIIYRFDQFDPATQLLLKMASVVSANGEPFTLHQLSHIFDENRNNPVDCFSLSPTVCLADKATKRKTEETTGLIEIVRDLVSRGDFIRITRSSMDMLSSTNSEATNDDPLEDEHQLMPPEIRHQGRTSIEFPDSVLTTARPMIDPSNETRTSEDTLLSYSFEFINALERRTFYDLMLNDQKEIIHHRVASYLEAEALTSSELDNRPPSAHTIFEEGFHWEHGRAWSSAMTCYYRSAMMLEAIGANEDSFRHLSAAYRMFVAMSVDAACDEKFEIRSNVLSTLHSGATTAEGSEKHTRMEDSLTKQDVYRMFGGDSLLLETGLQVLLRLGQSSFTLHDDVAVVSRLYEDALRLITITWNSGIQRTSSIAEKGGDGIKPPKSTGSLQLFQKKNSVKMYEYSAGLALSSDETEELDRKSVFFGLRDPTICFPILNGIAALYRNGKLADDAKRSKEAAIFELFIHLARSSEAEEYRLHLMQGLCLIKTLYGEINRKDESFDLSRQVMQEYNHHLHNDGLVQQYGNNRVPYTLACTLRDLRLKDRLQEASEYLRYILALVPQITHLHSLAIVCYPLCAVLAMQGSYRKAFTLFNHYAEQAAIRGGYSFFKPVNPLLLYAMKTMYLYQENCDGYLHSVAMLQEEQLTFGNELEDQIMTGDFLYASAEKRPMLYQSIDDFGFAAEFACATILYYRSLHITSCKLAHPDDESVMNLFGRISGYLIKALTYLDFALECHAKEVCKCAFSHNNCLILRASILEMMSRHCCKETTHEGIHCANFKAADVTSMLVASELARDRRNASSRASHHTAASAATVAGTDRTALASAASSLEDTSATIPFRARLLREARESLIECEEMAKQDQFVYVRLLAGAELHRLELDISLGRSIMENALDDSIELNGVKLVGKVFPSLQRQYPSIAQCSAKLALSADESDNVGDFWE